MQTARRLYVYLISGIGLGLLVAGLAMMLSVLLDRLGLRGTVIGGEGDVIGQQLTLAAALVAVGLPVWLIHWVAAERSVRPERPGAAIERTSDVRGLYFALALGILLAVAASGVSSVVQGVADELIGGSDFGFPGIADGLAIAIVAGAAWIYHLAIRTRDWARGPMTGGGAWLPRTYVYVATFFGLVALLTGIGELIGVLGRVALGATPEFVDPSAERWWEYPLTSAVSAIVVGGAVWLGHAWYAGRLIRDPGWRGESERPARLRMAFFVAVILATATGTLYHLGEGAGSAISSAAGASLTSEGPVAAILLPILAAVPFAIAWWLHLGSMRAEALASGDEERIDTEARLELYPMALVGLAFAATGAAWLIGVLVDVVFGGRVLSGSEFVRDQVARYAPFAVLGIVLWIWAWGRISARVATDPVGEAASTTRRATLLVVLAVSVIAGVIAAAIVLYRLFGSLFGVEQGGDAIAELSLPIGVLLVGSAIAAYHGTQLRRDQALRSAAAPPEPAAPEIRMVELRLSGPADGDLAAVVAGMRAQLPPGFELEGAPPPT
ncbi:MAG TPA: DUF5671 domain-containing protein [Candidatus Limnocylindria bacterium]|nr:DUF5671 domain-containing protein [Candidatus Limnocylindria bacterium]